jgi:hypothetical protein
MLPEGVERRLQRALARALVTPEGEVERREDALLSG